MFDSKPWVLASLVVGCAGDPGAETGTDPTSSATSSSTGPTTGMTTGMTTDPAPGGPIAVCSSLAPALSVAGTNENTAIAVDPAGTSLYVSVRDRAYRWTLGEGDDCGLVVDPTFTPVPVGEIEDLAVTAAGAVYASIDDAGFSPVRIWPAAEATACQLGPDDPLGGRSIAVGGDGEGLLVSYNDPEYHTQLYRVAPGPGCTLQLQWTESETHDAGFRPFALDADEQMHVLGRDADSNDVMLVFAADGALVTTYKGTKNSLCTASQVARCGADICVMSCWDMFRFASDGALLEAIDLTETFGTDDEYIGLAGAPDGTVYVLRVAQSAGPDGYPLSVIRISG